jgi:hypothetical protein
MTHNSGPRSIRKYFVYSSNKLLWYGSSVVGGLSANYKPIPFCIKNRIPVFVFYNTPRISFFSIDELATQSVLMTDWTDTSILVYLMIGFSNCYALRFLDNRVIL